MSMPYADHQEQARGVCARCAVVTLSDTRTEETDKSGGRIKQMLVDGGHEVVRYVLIPDDPSQLDQLLQELSGTEEIDLIITNGGTGISARDQTVPVIEEHLTTVLPGFGELFRMLSFEQIGSGAMLSRAVGGLAGRKLLFALPGSTAAVELAMSRLILPEISHLLAQARK
jgi:molybdenum cofactor biosynthesis protein B